MNDKNKENKEEGCCDSSKKCCEAGKLLGIAVVSILIFVAGMMFAKTCPLGGGAKMCPISGAK